MNSQIELWITKKADYDNATEPESEGHIWTSEQTMWGGEPEGQALWGLALSLSLLETTHWMVNALKILIFYFKNIFSFWEKY